MPLKHCIMIFVGSEENENLKYGNKSVLNNSATYRDKLLFNVSTVCAIIFLFAFYFKFNNIIYVFLGLIGISAFLFASLSWKNSFLLFLIYLSVFPNYAWGSRYLFFRGFYFSETFLVLFFVISVVWIIINNVNGIQVKRVNSSNFDNLLIFLLIQLFLSGIWGAYKGYNFKIVYLEFLYFSLYLYYFFYKKYLNDKALLSSWKWITGITIVVSIQYIMLAFSESDASSVFITRVVTQQPHLAQLCFPLLLSNIMFPNTLKKRLWSLIGIIPMTGMIFFSQQRGLWVGICFSILLVGGFVFFREYFTISKLLKFVLMLIIISLALFLLFVLVDKLFFGSIGLTILSRIESLSSLSTDASTNIRLSEIIRALRIWDDNIFSILFGTGLGCSYESIDATRPYTYSVDNSYVIVLWKMGILGLTLFLVLLFLLYKNGLYIYRHTRNKEDKQLVAGLLSGFGGLLVIALTNACIVRYRFIVIWALVFATIQVLYNRLKNDQVLLERS